VLLLLLMLMLVVMLHDKNLTLMQLLDNNKWPIVSRLPTTSLQRHIC